MNEIKVIAFDADDTLWENETFFREAEDKFSLMMSDYLPPHSVVKALLSQEIKTLPYYGYGIKGFVLAMIETAMEVSNKTISLDAIEKIIAIGKEMMDKPVVLLDGVEEVLQKLNGSYKLVMATKGDLLDQERKLKKSGLEKYFHHIEIVSEKQEADYTKLINHLDIPPNQFLMIGNSLKSDIIPILNVGGHAYHVPFHTTWELEKVKQNVVHENFKQLDRISELLDYILPKT